MTRTCISDEEIDAEVKHLLKTNQRKEAFLYLKKYNKLPYCPRLHLYALELPCGKRGECFCGACPNLPSNAHYAHDFNFPISH